MISLSDSIIEYLFHTSALLLFMGLISFAILRFFRIHGRVKLWIYSMLIVMPLVYPVKNLIPESAKIALDPGITFLSEFKRSDPQIKISSEKDFIPEQSVTEKLLEGEAFGGNMVNVIKSHERVNASDESLFRKLLPVNFGWKSLVSTLWATLFIILLFRTCLKLHSIKRIIKLGYYITDSEVLNLFKQCSGETGLQREPRVIVVEGIPSPMVLGFLRPVIILPEHLLCKEFRDGLRFALLHELMHVRRHHNWWLMIESVIGALFFFHPVFYWARNQIHEEMEHVCDNHVVYVTNNSLSYADFLLNEIWKVNFGTVPSMAMPFVTGVVKTANRIRIILEGSSSGIYSQIQGKTALAMTVCCFMSILLFTISPSANQSFNKISKTDFIHPYIDMDNNVPIKKLSEIGTTEEVNSLENSTDVETVEDTTRSISQDSAMVFVEKAIAEISAQKKVDNQIPSTAQNNTSNDEHPQQNLYNPDKGHAEINENTFKTESYEPTFTTYEYEQEIAGTEKEDIVIAQARVLDRAETSSKQIAEKKTEKYLSPPVNEIRSYRIRETKILDDQTILFLMRDGSIYLNRLIERCPSLNMSTGFSFVSFTGTLTMSDVIKPILPGGGPAPSGMLGKFYFFHHEGSLKNAKDLLENGLLKELVEEGAFE